MTETLDEIVYRYDSYVPLVGSTFTVGESGDTVAVELVSVTRLPARGECFSLTFRTADARLDQRTYRVEHPSLGEFPLFLVPLGPRDDGRMELEAVVNRLES
jgi:hypothetical protein